MGRNVWVFFSLFYFLLLFSEQAGLDIVISLKYGKDTALHVGALALIT